MTDNKPLDEQWDSLLDDWQNQPYEKVDASKLLRRLKIRTFYAKAILALDIIVTFALIITLVWAIVENKLDYPTRVYIGVIGVASVFFTYYEFKIRLKTWRMGIENPQQIIAKTISGLEGAIQYTKLIKYSAYFITPVVNWYIYEYGKLIGKPVIDGYLLANSLIVVMYVLAHIYQQKREKELRNTSVFSGEQNSE